MLAFGSSRAWVEARPLPPPACAIAITTPPVLPPCNARSRARGGRSDNLSSKRIEAAAAAAAGTPWQANGARQRQRGLTHRPPAPVVQAGSKGKQPWQERHRGAASSCQAAMAFRFWPRWGQRSPFMREVTERAAFFVKAAAAVYIIRENLIEFTVVSWG